jgi:hypothetical protein
MERGREGISRLVRDDLFTSEDGSYRLRLFQDLEIAKNADRQAGNASASDSAM